MKQFGILLGQGHTLFGLSLFLYSVLWCSDILSMLPLTFSHHVSWDYSWLKHYLRIFLILDNFEYFEQYSLGILQNRICLWFFLVIKLWLQILRRRTIDWKCCFLHMTSLVFTYPSVWLIIAGYQAEVLIIIFFFKIYIEI